MEEEQEYTCIIPRNLNKPDTFPIGRYEISLKQVGYLITGGAACWYGLHLVLPSLAKIVISTLGLNACLILAFGKHKGVDTDKLVLDGMTYLVRSSYYKKIEKGGDLIVTIKANEKERNVSTKEKKLSI